VEAGQLASLALTGPALDLSQWPVRSQTAMAHSSAGLQFSAQSVFKTSSAFEGMVAGLVPVWSPVFRTVVARLHLDDRPSSWRHGVVSPEMGVFLARLRACQPRLGGVGVPSLGVLGLQAACSQDVWATGLIAWGSSFFCGSNVVCALVVSRWGSAA